MKTNQELLDEANKIDFVLMKSGGINYHKHSAYERGLFFIKKAIELHGIDKYQYGSVIYVDGKTKVSVGCPEHGEFLVLASNHVGKASGCPKCSGGVAITQEDFVQKAVKKHGMKYSYEKALYRGSDIKVTITCPTHGDFEQVPHNHLHGQGCPRCTKTFNTEDFIQKASLVHRGYYDYSSAVYTNYACKVIITCPVHGDFMQLPSSHLRGAGCPQCAGHNHDILYLLRCKDTGWYKIGITTTNTKARIRQIGGNIEEVFHVVCNDPRKHESILHKKYARDREYNLCVKDGNTEFFSLNEEQVAKIRQYMASIAINQSTKQIN